MTEMNVDTSTPVLVTGATGYVAGWVIKKLLERGLTVHATVRNASNKDRLSYLQQMADASPGAITFFEADLVKPGSFAEAMKGCSTVFHIASPYTVSVKDAQKELVEPALEGTRNVLQQVNETPSVNRVVLTSSCAAIFGDSADVAEMPGQMLSEDVWNTSSSLGHQAYSYSKTVAEREAWKMHAAQDRWRLVVMNPAGIFGPGVKFHGDAESFSVMKQMGDGTFAMGVPDWRIGFVDVRDVAEAHLRGAFMPGAEGRHILVGRDSGFVEMATILRQNFPGYPIGKRVMPKFALWLVGPLANPVFTRKIVSRNVGHPWKSNTTKSREKLGVTYRPLEETLVEHFQQVIDAGTFAKKKAA
ncbi:MAG: NAD-dependent epimerase/dehydratase family protein [Myxococcales bacterium]|nr:NAD-dependent epimerase/dehydratase family protein [Myxococcales bacterium]